MDIFWKLETHKKIKRNSGGGPEWAIIWFLMRIFQKLSDREVHFWYLLNRHFPLSFPRGSSIGFQREFSSVIFLLLLCRLIVLFLVKQLCREPSVCCLPSQHCTQNLMWCKMILRLHSNPRGPYEGLLNNTAEIQ